MKTAEQIDHARGVLCKALTTPGLNQAQSALFGGMLNALAWVADSPNGSTLDRLLAGEPIAAGKDPAKAYQTLESLSKDWTYEADCGCRVTFFCASGFRSSRLLPGEGCPDHLGRDSVARDRLIALAREERDRHFRERRPGDPEVS